MKALSLTQYQSYVSPDASKQEAFITQLDAIMKMQVDLRQRAQQTREQRYIPEQTIDDLEALGFFLTLQPKRYGGLELDPQQFFILQMALAEACMSTGWVGGIIACHAFQIALMDDRAQQDVWGDSIHTRVSSSYAPMAKVEVLNGGFKVSGRWGWSSGCDHCTWALLGGIVPGEGYRTFLIPRSDYEIIDTWFSMGLQGTGSKDLVVKDAFVPDYRSHKQMDGFLGTNPGHAVNDSALFRLPWAQIFVRIVSTPAIASCKDALRLFIDGAVSRQSNDPTKLAGDIATQERIAFAQHQIDEMQSVMMANFNLMMARLNTGEVISLMDRIKYRYQASLVIDKSIAVVDSLFSSAGGRSVFQGSEIQQRFLDIHTARAHVANNPSSFARNMGAVALGMENQDFFV